MGRWCTAHLQRAILAAFALTPPSYTLTQLRYDLRKMKAHGLIERDGSRYAYRLPDKAARSLSSSCFFSSAFAARSRTVCSTTRGPRVCPGNPSRNRLQKGR